MILDEIIEYKRKAHIKEMWSLFTFIGWGIRSTDYKSIRKWLSENYSEKEINKMKDFSVYQRKLLAKRLKEYEEEFNLGNYYNVSDDGFWDLTAHIVGLGKYWYDQVLNNPEIARDISLNNMYQENFEYIFNTKH